MHEPTCGCQRCVEIAWRLLSDDEDHRVSTTRSGRVEPGSSRLARIAPHPATCSCRECLVPSPTGWLCRQFWHWTPVGQMLYCSLAAVEIMLQHLYS